MKKLLLILILSLLFISCEEPHKQEIVGYCSSKVEIINNDIGYDIKVQTLTYKEHDYIMFKTGNGKKATMAVEHDPDCKSCKTKN